MHGEGIDRASESKGAASTHAVYLGMEHFSLCSKYFPNIKILLQKKKKKTTFEVGAGGVC